MEHYLYKAETGECYGPYPTRKYAEHYRDHIFTVGESRGFVVITELELTEPMRMWREARKEVHGI